MKTKPFTKKMVEMALEPNQRSVTLVLHGVYIKEPFVPRPYHGPAVSEFEILVRNEDEELEVKFSGKCQRVEVKE